MVTEASRVEPPSGEPGRFHEKAPIDEHRKRHQFRARLIILLIASALTAVVATQLSGARGPSPVSLQSLSGTVAADGHHVSVSATIRNDRDQPQTARVWWLLSEPDATPPWEHQAYQSAVQEVTLAPGEQRVLQWEEDALIPSGTYALSAWIHSRDDTGEFIHSDGRVQESPYLEIRNPTNLLRKGISGDVTITAVSMSSQSQANPVPLRLTATVANRSSQAREFPFRWDMVRSGITLQWWTKPVVLAGSERSVHLGPKQTTSVSIDQLVPIPPGGYLVRLSAGSGDAGEEALISRPPLSAAAWDPSIRRAALPAGSIMIRSVQAPIEWHEQDPPTVRVVLQNLSQNRQRVRLFGFLNKPGTVAPWESSASQLSHVDALIGRRAQQEFALGLPSPAPPGTYEFSVWVHAADDRGEFNHSDGVRFARQVTWWTDRVLLKSFSGTVAADGHHVSVSATIRNDRDQPQTARVWWLLSEPDATPPWEHQAYQSAVQEVTLAPGEQRVLQWEEDALIPSGTYALSAWIHSRDDTGEFIHSDGRVQESPYLEIRNYGGS